ncbi:hypothetical protein NGB36_24510 [Streptomyces sp. RB6PN25]|uniref:Uncharacterized protein n=1 Tax=Streptomyces humicola TaxID=2953240 RepID=A0ABT1Q157_9ACTN|nr:hypothetical protein [Streptomyces humicola]MCQ4083671.1 hypothetical protein [Streptomyces humicola]
MSDQRESSLSTEDLAQLRDRTREESAPHDAPAFPEEAGTSEQERESVEPQSQAESATAEEEAQQLLTEKDEDSFRERWHEIQNDFVDDPREAVHDADALVADVMQTLAGTFAKHKQDLEAQWNRGNEVDTEELRMALRHYRSFFNRLLTA